MIPLKDESRTATTFPAVTIGIIALNAVFFALELMLGDEWTLRMALVPKDVVAGHHLYTLFTSMFLHAGWLHILGNMLFLWVFGPAIEEAMGPRRYLAFYLLGGLMASAAQIVAGPTSAIPSMGASGAIAAVMGAFLVTYPSDEIRTVIFLGIFFRVTMVKAIVLVGLWFVVQLIDATGALRTSAAQQGGVAYMAHVGGFVFGMLTGRLFEGAAGVPGPSQEAPV